MFKCSGFLDVSSVSSIKSATPNTYRQGSICEICSAGGERRRREYGGAEYREYRGAEGEGAFFSDFSLVMVHFACILKHY